MVLEARWSKDHVLCSLSIVILLYEAALHIVCYLCALVPAPVSVATRLDIPLADCTTNAGWTVAFFPRMLSLTDQLETLRELGVADTAEIAGLEVTSALLKVCSRARLMVRPPIVCRNIVQNTPRALYKESITSSPSLSTGGESPAIVLPSRVQW